LTPQRSLSLVASDALLVQVVAASFLNGAVAASLGPFTSLIAVEAFGLADATLSLVLAIGAMVGVVAAVAAGIVTDQRANRRSMAIATGLVLAAAGAVVLGGQSGAAFIVAHALLLPAGRALNGQIFALARLVASRHPPASGDAITSVVRTAFAVPFVVILPLWAALFPAGADLTAVYWVPVASGVIVAAMLWSAWPADGGAPWADPRSGLSFAAALRELSDLRLLGRVTLIGIVGCGSYANYVTIALIFSPSRPPSDVALFAALVAGLEMPAILAAPMLTARIGRVAAICIGACLLAVSLALLPLAAPFAAVWLLALPIAVAQGVTLSTPIAYLQDLVSSRPGAGGALLAVNSVVIQLVVALVFAVATALAGYWLSNLMVAVLMVVGAALLWRLDAQR
jgi:SET family sugar efflux transporter-like MFS transporter